MEAVAPQEWSHPIVHPEKAVALVNYVDQLLVMPSLMHSKKIVDLLDLEKVAANLLVVIWILHHLAKDLLVLAKVDPP